jgi:D-lactate dehydrogenase (cytochrome)
MSCSGTNTYRYGTIKEWVISMTVVMADGSIVKTRRRPRKSSAGYDLTHLIIGSEGTLGIVTEAVLRLAPCPKNVHVGIATFPDATTAIRSAIALIKSGQLLEAIEFLDEFSMLAINKTGVSDRHWQETPTLFLKFAGEEAIVKTQTEMVRNLCSGRSGVEFMCSSESKDVESWWAARKAAAKALVGMKEHPSDLFIHADAAVPISRLAEMIDETHTSCQNLGLFCSTIGHLGDGKLNCPTYLKWDS